MLQNTKKTHDNTTGKKECRILITIREKKKRKNISYKILHTFSQ